jgi:hypothetical protein
LKALSQRLMFRTDWKHHASGTIALFASSVYFWRSPMGRFTSSVSLLVALAFLALGSAVSCPQWLRSLGVDYWGLADAYDAASAARSHLEQLEEDQTTIQARLQKRQELIRELLADRLDLSTAAARFQQLDQLQPCVARSVARLYPHAGPGERACRHLLIWIDGLGDQITDAATCRKLLDRLEEELEYQLCVHGEVKLPEESPVR